MKLATRNFKDIKIVDFKGELDSNTSPDAEKYLKEIIANGGKYILAHFGKLDYISSAGLRILLVTAKELNTIGGELRICELNETVEEIFSISGFVGIFNVFGSEQEAIA